MSLSKIMETIMIMMKHIVTDIDDALSLLNPFEVNPSYMS